jgi:hypothetical protein
MNDQLSLELVKIIALPRLKQAAGPLHTILQDGDGNVYYTDEVNHSLVSLDADGRIRWQQGGRGKGQGQFYYPRGFDLGWVTDSGSARACLAVADSWNARIQFFDLDGRFLFQWVKAAATDLGEVVDVRFLGTAGGAGGSVSGHWLVLDHEHHRLLVLDVDGCLRFQIGRGMHPRFEERWEKAGIAGVEDFLPPGLVRQCADFDPLYYPQRIFGHSREGIFLLEQGSRRLKQVFLGNLLPVWALLPRGGEWISADSAGLLSWSVADATLSSCSAGAKSWREARIDGTPVASGRYSHEVWIQNQDSLSHWRWQPGVEFHDGESGCNGVSTLRRMSAEIENRFAGGARPAGIENLHEVATRITALGHRILSACGGAPLHADAAVSFSDDLKSLRAALTTPNPDIHPSVHDLFLAFLKLRLLQYAFPRTRELEIFEAARRRLEDITRPIVDAFVEIVRCIDALNHTRVVDQIRRPPSARLSESHQVLLRELEASLVNVLPHLARWSGRVPSSESVLDLPAASQTGGSPGQVTDAPALWLARPQKPADVGSSSRHLREVDRISLGGSCHASPAGPASMAHGANGEILVALFSANRILRLDAQGRVSGEIGQGVPGFGAYCGPFGIAVDDEDRVWVSEVLHHRVRIYDSKTNTVRCLDDLGPELGPLCYPHGMCRGPDGSILVVDSGNHRIVAFAHDGSIGTLCGGPGAKIGEFRYPVSLARGTPALGNSLWVVDQGNHRVQQLDDLGRPMREIGSCGLGDASLLLPESLVQYDDGTLAIDQYACTKALKLFTGDGRELDFLELDYCARGMLIHQGLLLVADAQGDSLRVYERI